MLVRLTILSQDAKLEDGTDDVSGEGDIDEEGEGSDNDIAASDWR